MPAAQERNDEMARLLSADLLSSDDRNVAFEAYDTAGNTFTSLEVHSFNTTRLNTAPTVFSFDGSILTIAEAGIYQLSFHAVFVNVGATQLAEASILVDEDPATGTFAAVPAFAADVALPISGRNSAGCTCLRRVGAGYRYRVRVVRNSGVDTLAVVNNGSLLNAMRLFKLR